MKNLCAMKFMSVILTYTKSAVAALCTINVFD